MNLVPRYVGVVKKVVEKVYCCTADYHKYHVLVGSRHVARHNKKYGTNFSKGSHTLHEHLLLHFVRI